MSDLDIGTLTAKLRLEGAAEFNRDVDRAGNAFTDLADQAKSADRQINQISSPRGMADIRRDTTQAQSALGDLGTQGRRTSDQLRGVGDGMGQARRSIQTDTQAARRDIDDLGVAGRRAGDQLRQGAQEGGNAFSSSLAGLNDRISGQLGDAGDSGGTAFVAGFGSKIAGLASKAGPWGAALAALIGAGTIGGVQLAGAVMDGFEQDTQRRFAAAKFGWSDDVLVQAGLAAGNAYGENFGESVQQNIMTAGTAIQTGLIDGNATAAQIQPVIERLSTVSSLLGTEIPETALAAGQMVKTGLAKDSTEALDLLTAAQQKGLNTTDDLLDSVTEYSSQWQKLGIDGATALGTIAQMQTAGVRNTDLAADALKEFSIRAIDGSESTKDAFTSLGLDAEATGAAFAAGGDQALGMSRTVLLALANIKDPIERNRVGTELMGTQWEDTGKAIDKLDLAKAGRELGDVGGAADRAAQKMSGPGSAMEEVRRKIEVAADGVKLKLAEAFGPQVGQWADWISAHQDEIVTFFSQVASAALRGAQAGAYLGWAMLKSFAGIMSAANGLSYVFDPLLYALQAVGATLGKLPGSMGDAGRSIESTARTMREGMHNTLSGIADGANSAADGMYSFANVLGTAAGGMSNLGSTITFTKDQMGALHDSITAIPDSKTIVISDNSPETLDKLKALGLKVVTLPNGQVQVTANDELAQRVLNDITRPREVEVTVKTKAEQTAYGQALLNAWRTQGQADGGQVFGPGGPRDDAFLVPLSNREWVQPVSSVDYYGNAFMESIRTRRFPRVFARGYADGGQVDTGYGMPPGSSGSSGFPDWVTQLGTSHGVTPATYAGHQESDRGEAGYAPNPQHLNRGIDWTGSVDKMQAFAEYMMAQAASDPAIEQVIWMNPNTGQKLGWHGRSPDTDGSYYAADYGGHQDHVHTRFGSRVGAAAAANGQQPQGIKDITLTAQSSRDDVARKIIAEGRKRGYTDDQIADVLSMAIQESNLDPEAQNGNWKGVFQQDDSYPGRDDPNTQITGFYDRLDSKKGSPGWSQNMDDNLFWVQQAPGADTAKAAVEGGRSGYMDEINSHQDEATKLVTDLGPSVGTLDTTAAGATPSGATQNVFVTNWPAKIADVATTTTTPTTTTPTTPTKDDPSKLKPSGPLPIVAYAEGGWGDRPDSAQMLRNANAWVTLAGEAGREAFIPMDGSDRSKNLWLQAGHELGMVRAYAGGGFGGYSEDTSDWMAPKSWMDYAYLAAGAGFTAASVIGPYAQMAAAGQVTLGDLAPQPSTSSNDIPGLSEALSKSIEALNNQLTELRKAMQDNKTPHIVVQDVKGLLEKTGIHLVGL